MQQHILGIDFGTTNRVAAYWDGSKAVVVQHSSSGRFIMPSVVYYGPDQTLVGDDALLQLTDAYRLPDPDEQQQVYECTIRSIKRRMVPGGIHILPHREEGVLHEQIVADILRHLKLESERLCLKGEQAERVVLTHPVTFDAPKRKAIADGAKLAGFSEVVLLEEPIAAAIGYAAQAGKPAEHILVYDFGGSSFETAYVVRNGESYDVIASNGDAECGGDDIDMILYDHFERLILGDHGRPLSHRPGLIDRLSLHLCQRIKYRLSFPSALCERVSHVISNGAKPINLSYTLDRATFEGLIRPVVDRTVEEVKRLLDKVRKKGIEPKDLRVVLTGGSSELPLVRNLLSQALPTGASLDHTHLPTTTVAIGAATAGGRHLVGNRLQLNKQIMSNHILGIDFGTTNSVAAYWNGAQAEEVKQPSSGKTMLPSVVYYGPDDSTPLVGDEALQQLADAYGFPDEEERLAVCDCTVQSIKRRMHIDGEHILPHKEEGVPHVQIVADILG